MKSHSIMTSESGANKTNPSGVDVSEDFALLVELSDCWSNINKKMLLSNLILTEYKAFLFSTERKPIHSFKWLDISQHCANTTFLAITITAVIAQKQQQGMEEKSILLLSLDNSLCHWPWHCEPLRLECTKVQSTNFLHEWHLFVCCDWKCVF